MGRRCRWAVWSRTKEMRLTGNMMLLSKRLLGPRASIPSMTLWQMNRYPRGSAAYWSGWTMRKGVSADAGYGLNPSSA